jgi:Tol biopolymer transport system component
VIDRCLAKDLAGRYESSRDLFRDLASIRDHLSEISTDAQKAAAISLAGPRSRRRWAVPAALALAAAITLGLVVVRSIARRTPAPEPNVVRFTIMPPPSVAFSPGGVAVPAAQLAVSPDGRAIAFVAAPTGGRRLIWVRKLHEIDAKAVPGTVGASYPFWSPDGVRIGYFSEGKLMRVDLLGGRPQVLADAHDGRGGTWSRMGQILFAPEASGALYQVNENGGSPTRVTTVDRDRREFAHRWPQFLPDGRQFLFFVSSEDAQVRGIYYGSVGDPKPRFVLASSYQGIFAAPAHLLFVRDGALVAQPFRQDSPAVNGTVSTLVRNIGGSSDGYGSYSVSDTGVLVHAAPFDPERELVWFTRSGERLERADGPFDYVDFRLAADDRIAVARNQPDLRTSDIFVVDQRRGQERRLTMHPALDASPVWSPDSTRLVFRSKRRNNEINNANDLYEVSTNGSGAERLLLSTPLGKYPTDWSPDGRTIVYHTPNTFTGWDVWMLPLGEDPTPTALIATAANEMQAKFSTNGRWIAYASDAFGRPDVYVKAYPPDARVWQVSNGGGTQPMWTADGRELLFVAPDGTLMAASVDTSSQFRSHRIRPQFRIPAPGFGPPFSPNYAISADGKKVLVNASRRDGGVPALEVILNWPSQLAAGQ